MCVKVLALLSSMQLSCARCVALKERTKQEERCIPLTGHHEPYHLLG
jgi:hypothetical protein